MATNWERRVKAARLQLHRKAQLLAAKHAFWAMAAYAWIREHLLKKESARDEFWREIEKIERRLVRIGNRFAYTRSR